MEFKGIIEDEKLSYPDKGIINRIVKNIGLLLKNKFPRKISDDKTKDLLRGIAVIKENFDGINNEQLAAMILELLPFMKSPEIRPSVLSYIADYDGDNEVLLLLKNGLNIGDGLGKNVVLSRDNNGVINVWKKNEAGEWIK